MPSAPTLRLELRPSRLQRALTAVLVAGAALALLLASWPAWARAAAALAVVVIATLLARRRTDAATGLEWRGDGSWWLFADHATQGGGAPPRPLRLRSARVIGPLLALRFATDAGPVRIDLWPDSAGPDALRRLRIRLQRLPPGPAAEARGEP